MQRLGAVSILSVLVAGFPWCGLGAAQRISPRVAHARYVALGYDVGDHFVQARDERASPDLSTSDRAALAGLRVQLVKWNRYIITDRLDHAELLIVIRPGRLASAEYQPLAAPLMRAPGLVLGAEHSSPNDTLAVYESAGGKFGALLWREEQRNGLSGPSALLFQHFRAAVESISKP